MTPFSFFFFFFFLPKQAYGYAFLTFNKLENTLCYKLMLESLTSAPTAAHIHQVVFRRKKKEERRKKNEEKDTGNRPPYLSPYLFSSSFHLRFLFLSS